MSALEERRDSLYQRLENGYQKIEQALGDGKDIIGLEDFWLTLLNEYERVCDELQADERAQLPVVRHDRERGR